MHNPLSPEQIQLGTFVLQQIRSQEKIKNNYNANEFQSIADRMYHDFDYFQHMLLNMLDAQTSNTNTSKSESIIGCSYNPWFYSDGMSSWVIIKECGQTKYYLSDFENGVTTWHTKVDKAKHFYTINQIEVYIKNNLQNRPDVKISAL